MFSYQTQLNHLKLSTGADIDIAVGVRVKLKLEGDLRSFFRNVFSNYGFGFADYIPSIIDQIIREALQESGIDRDTAIFSTNKARNRFSQTISPEELFEIVCVDRFEITRDDESRSVEEANLQRLRLERTTRLFSDETNKIADAQKLTTALEFSNQFGLDPMFFYDPNFYLQSAQNKIKVLEILGKNADNIALLAESNPALVQSVFGHSGLLSGHTRTNQSLTGHQELPEVTGASSPGYCPVGTYIFDDFVNDLPLEIKTRIKGGVFRRAKVDEKEITFAFFVCATQRDVEFVNSRFAEDFDGTAFVAVDGSKPANNVFTDLLAKILGVAQSEIRVEYSNHQLIWEVPQSIVASGEIGEFLAETVCDLFNAPVAVAVV